MCVTMHCGNDYLPNDDLGLCAMMSSCHIGTRLIEFPLMSVSGNYSNLDHGIVQILDNCVQFAYPHRIRFHHSTINIQIFLF